MDPTCKLLIKCMIYIVKVDICQNPTIFELKFLEKFEQTWKKLKKKLEKPEQTVTNLF